MDYKLMGGSTTINVPYYTHIIGSPVTLEIYLQKYRCFAKILGQGLHTWRQFTNRYCSFLRTCEWLNINFFKKFTHLISSQPETMYQGLHTFLGICTRLYLRKIPAYHIMSKMRALMTVHTYFWIGKTYSFNECVCLV